MTSNLVERLRNWPCIYPEDLYEPEGHLYEEAADRIEELEAENKLLLEALEVMTERQSLYSGGHDDDIIAKARAAIKKAKGEE